MENRADLNERHISQDSALQLLTNMGYKYISREDCVLQRGSQYQVLLKDILRGQLRKLNRYRYAGVENEFSAANIERAITELDVPLTKGLVQASEEVYDALMLGKSYPETVGEGRLQSFDLKYSFSNEKRYGDEIRKEEGYLLSELLLNENEYFPFLEENSSNHHSNQKSQM